MGSSQLQFFLSFFIGQLLSRAYDSHGRSTEHKDGNRKMQCFCGSQFRASTLAYTHAHTFTPFTQSGYMVEPHTKSMRKHTPLLVEKATKSQGKGINIQSQYTEGMKDCEQWFIPLHGEEDRLGGGESTGSL